MPAFKGYICEKCGKEFRAPHSGLEQPVAINLSFNFGSYTPSNKHEYGLLWCRNCVMLRGMHYPMTKEEKSIPVKKLTTEEKITELLLDLGFVHSDDL